MHVSLFLLTPASFALLASSCCRVWCQLLALVGLNSSPTRRPDQEVDARRGVVNEHSCNTPPATRRVLNQITTEMTRQGWTLHIDTFETFSLNSAFQRLGYA